MLDMCIVLKFHDNCEGSQNASPRMRQKIAETLPPGMKKSGTGREKRRVFLTGKDEKWRIFEKNEEK